MKAIYKNNIFAVSSISKPDQYHNVYMLLSSEIADVKISAVVYDYYEYESCPLLFIPQSIPDHAKLLLIGKFDEWYGDIDQDTADWALEFQIVVRMILHGFLIINPAYLAIEDILTELLDILQSSKQTAAEGEGI